MIIIFPLGTRQNKTGYKNLPSTFGYYNLHVKNPPTNWVEIGEEAEDTGTVPMSNLYAIMQPRNVWIFVQYGCAVVVIYSYSSVDTIVHNKF